MSAMDSEQNFKHLIAKAKQCIHSESTQDELRKGLAYYKRAFRIHSSDKLDRRIKKLETYLDQLGDSDGEGDDDDKEGEEMAHVGEGFYLYRGLYDKLYDHQRKGVLFFWRLWRMKKGGILGDDMGLGKTIQVCAFLAGMYDADRIKSVIIVVPVAVIVNWMNEFQKWVPGLDVYDFHDQSKKERERILKRIQSRGGICVTSYGLIINNADMLSHHNGRDFNWDYVILDEGHKIKNPTSKSAKGVHAIPAKNRIVLSGTPLMNNLKELWSLFDWTHAGQLLGNAKTFSMEYEGPITRAREKDATAGEQRLGVEMSKGLQDMIGPFFLRRTKGEVLIKEDSGHSNAPHMPILTRKNDLICWVFLSEIQERIYTDFIQMDEIRELLSSAKSPLTALTALKKICDHPRLMSNRQCEQLGLTVSQGVDMDRLDAMVAEDTAHFSVDHIPDELLIEESGKMVFLVELLDNLKAEGHRCLVFSQSRKILNIIQKVAKNRGHRLVRIDGTIRQLDERQRIIDKFMNDTSYNLFLLTTQVGGVGLTLTAADRVVIYDPSWNPATDSQAVDRAFRIGQDKNVVVYRLITCGSIEEKIYRRQIFKDSINRMTTGDTKNPFRYFTKQDLRELFQLSDTRVSVTQQQIEQLQHGRRKTDTRLDHHIAFLYSLELFGISDHDLMFEICAHKEIEGEADVEDKHSEEYIRNRALKARQTLMSESEANVELVKNLGKYPGPQSDDLEKLFNKIRPAAGSSQQPSRRNFPKPAPLFSSADLISSQDLFTPASRDSKVDKSVERETEAQLEDLTLDDESQDPHSKSPRSPSPPPSHLISSHKSKRVSDDDHFVISEQLTSFAGLLPETTGKERKENYSPVRRRQSTLEEVGQPKSPYSVVKETLVFSPASLKPLISMESTDDAVDDLYLAEKLTLLEKSPKSSLSASRKRKSSICRRSTFGGQAKLLDLCHRSVDESPADSPIVTAKKHRRMIISDDEDCNETVTRTKDISAGADANKSSAALESKDCQEEVKDTRDDEGAVDEEEEEVDDEEEERGEEEELEEVNENEEDKIENDDEQEDEEDDEDEDEEDDDDDFDEEKFKYLINQGKAALRNRDLQTALYCFEEANEICGGNDSLSREIERIRNRLKVSPTK